MEKGRDEALINKKFEQELKNLNVMKQCFQKIHDVEERIILRRKHEGNKQVHRKYPGSRHSFRK